MAQESQVMIEQTSNPPRSRGEDRSRWQQVANNLVLHLHPVNVPAQALRFSYTWGLGGISTVLAMLLGLTGLLLVFRYDARVDYAYTSIQQLETQVIFGSLVRSIHHWTANLLVITTFLHLLRVFFTGSYKQGRTMNWLIGVGLLLVVLASNFTGYLLPWDQLSYWAITVSTTLLSYIPLIGNTIRTFLLGGPQVGQGALSNFYAIHVVFLPMILVCVMAYHFWKVRKNGGISQPLRKESERVERLSTIPNLVNVEVTAAVLMLTLVTIFSMFQSAPMGAIANPYNSPNPAKAAWYFVGLQELLLHMHPLAALGLLGLLLAALAILPVLDRRDDDIGVYFRSTIGKRAALVGLLLGVDLIPLLVVLDEFVIDLPGWLPGMNAAISNGLIPFLLSVLALALIYMGIRWGVSYHGNKANHSEAVLGLWTFILVSLVMLTVMGIFFRGPNMALVLPF
jgi:quinol-cytochrome oxidoreductase complex cytochrome b subunit